MFRFCCVSQVDMGAEMTGDSETETTYMDGTSSSDPSDEEEREPRAITVDDRLVGRVVGTNLSGVEPVSSLGRIVEERDEEEGGRRRAQEAIRPSAGATDEEGEREEQEEEEEEETGPRRLEVTIDRGPLGLNISVDNTGIGIQILEIKTGGAMENYNKASSRCKQVKPCDFVTCVNGATDMQEMLDRIKTDVILNLQLIRPEPMWIKIRRGGKPWGLNLTYQNISSHVEITEVIDGAINDYNESAPADLRVKPKDFIESVNGLMGVEKMVNYLKSGASDIDLKVLRMGF